MNTNSTNKHSMNESSIEKDNRKRLKKWADVMPMVTASALITGSLLATSFCHGQQVEGAEATGKAESTIDLGAEFQLGIEQDSSLSVEELDQSINQSDVALLSQAKLNAAWKPGKTFTLKGGYSYSGRNYQDYSEFDTAINQLFADGSLNLDVATLGLSHFYADAQLDGEGLLELNQTSLYLSKLIDKRLFLRFAADLKDKAFDGRPDRDADGYAFSGDAYLFFNQARSFVTVGLSMDDEDANTPELDYSGLGFKARVSNRFELLSLDNKLALGYRYKDKDYSNVDPLIGAERSDKRHVFELDWELWFNDNIAMINGLSYGDYQSNLESADYDETLASVSFRLKL